ncbi:hypothetical protein DFH27DRAFT_100819 [Peziza echinospora]|nr:hypothetical protein DFH27DRAFT_100819 [Peziza echinospora]
MAPSSFGPFDDTPGQPRRSNIFMNNAQSSNLAGETPFRPNGGGSVFSPNPNAGKKVGGLFGSGGFQAHKMDTEEDPEPEEEDEDGEYEVDESPAAFRKPAGPFSYPNLLNQGIPKLAPTREPEVNYSSPTDGDDEDSPKYGDYDEEEEEEEEEEDDEDGENEEDYDEENEDEEEDGDGEYEEDDEVDENGEHQESMDVDDGFHGGHRKGAKSSKAPISARIFLANNPPSLITQSNNILTSLVNLISPASTDEDTLPEASPHHRNIVTPAKKAAYLAKHVQLFLSHLQHVAHAVPHSSLPNAYYLAHILLLLHHPQPNFSGRGQSPIEVYRQFINTHHPNPTNNELQDLHAYHPSASVSPSYWDILAHLTLRGELTEVEALIKGAGWNNLEAERDGVVVYKYADDELAVIDRVCNGACRLISAAPDLFGKGRTEDEKFGEWRIYRGRVAAAVEELKSLSTSMQREDTIPEEDEEPEYTMQKVSTFRNGFRVNTLQKVLVVKPRKNLVRGDDKPIKKVPREIEVGLMNIYSILSGKIDAIISACERWEEAVLGVVIWRRYLDEEELEEDDEMDGSGPKNYLQRSLRATSALRATSLRKPQPEKRQSRRTLSDLESLKAAFRRVTNRDLPIDTTSQRELGLSHVLQGDWKAVLDVLTKQEQNDGMTAHATAEFILEIAKLADWSTKDCEDFFGATNVQLGSFFDAGDMSAFSRGVKEADAEKDRAKRTRKREEKIIEAYSRCLVEAGNIPVKDHEEEMELDGQEQEQPETFEGWEIAMQVLQRWSLVTAGEAAPWSKKLASEILSSLPLTDPAQVEKLLHHCKAYSLDDTYTQIAASYADHLYGNAELGSSLLYFSRAANRTKIHTILTRLLSQSLLLSTAYPPREKLDDTLTQLLEKPSNEEDEMLRYELSGYAAVRIFYEARDSGRKEDAARALVALIRSAGEQVDGGRNVDEEWGSAVEWWMAGSLIGEALAFLNQNKRHFTLREIFDILKVIQDLSSSIENTYSFPRHATNKADIFLRKSILAYTTPAIIPRLLRKSTSKLTASSATKQHLSTSMLSSWQHLEGTSSDDDEEDSELDDEDAEEVDDGFAIIDDEDVAGIVEIERGWDWRGRMVSVLESEEAEGKKRRAEAVVYGGGAGGDKAGFGSSSGGGRKQKSIGGVLETVVRVARMGFAKELARAWLDGEGEEAVLTGKMGAAAAGLGGGVGAGAVVPYITLTTGGHQGGNGGGDDMFMDLGI